MRLATTIPIATLLSALGLAGCSTPPPDAKAQAAATPDPSCNVHTHSGMIRPGDNVPFSMHVQNVGHWCFSGFGFSGVSALGSRVVDEASHGEVRLLARSGGIVFGYRPKPDYVGSDSFLISMPSGTGYEFNIAVSVEVTH